MKSLLNLFVYSLAGFMLAGLFLLPGCGNGRDDGAQITRLKLSHITAPGSAWDLGAQKFAELLHEKSGGGMEVDIYPQAQLANRNQQAELNLMQSGVIDFSFESSIILALFLDRRFDVFNLPWAFEDYAAAHAAVDGELWTQAKEWLKAKGIHILAAGDNGFRQLTNSSHPVEKPEDLVGLQIRVAGSPLFLDTFRTLDAAPQTMNFGEVFTALRQGTVDGQENPLSIIDTSRLDEVQTHLTLWNYVYDPIFLCISEKKWGGFSPEEQAMIEEAAREAMAWQRQYVEKQDEELPRALAERGMKVRNLTAAERSAFRAKMGPVWNRAAEVIGKELVESVLVEGTLQQ
jgi:tripartite ATP-independent transporter DctP family solute receptor